MKRVLVVVASVLLLSGCVISPTPGPEPTADPDGFSNLDESGIAQIKASNLARFDMSSGRIPLSDVNATVGFPLSDVVADEGTFDIEIVGPNGTLTAQSDHLRFLNFEKSTSIDFITYFLTTESDAEFFQLIRDGVTDFGIDSEVAEHWITSRAIDSDPASDFALPLGTALGFNVSYELSYDPTTPVQVIIVQVYPLE